MKVINLSLDSQILEPTSVAAVRARAYGTRLEAYTIVIPTRNKMNVQLAENVRASGSGGGIKLVQFVTVYLAACAYAKTTTYDVITSQDPFFSGLVAYLVARRYRLGLEVQVHGIEKLSRIRKLIIKFLLRRASVIRANSERTKERLVREFRGDASRIYVVPIHVDVASLGLDEHQMSESEREARQVVREKFQKQYGSCFNFLTVSRLVPIKNISMQLQALSRISGEFSKVRLHIVGDGPERTQLERQTKSMGLEEKVAFHGALYGHALGALYLDCDAFLLTSHYEGWGMVIVEALHAGLPVIMTDVGCAGELIEKDISGLVIPIGDVDALVRAMQRTLSEPQLAERLAEEGRIALTKLPTFDAVLDRYLTNWEVAAAHRL